jgi:hypothetical protein
MTSLIPKSVNIFDDTMREGLQIESPDIPVSEKMLLFMLLKPVFSHNHLDAP